MIVIDSSALLAILLNEPEKRAFEKIIAGAKRCLVSAVNAHETAMVLRMRIGRAAVGRLWYLLAKSNIEVVPFDDAQVGAINSLQSLRQGHSLEGTPQSMRLRGLCSGQTHERAFAVQGQRFCTYRFAALLVKTASTTASATLGLPPSPP